MSAVRVRTSAVQARHGERLVQLLLTWSGVALFFSLLTDWREGRVPEPVGAEKVEKERNTQLLVGVDGLLPHFTDEQTEVGESVWFFFFSP